MDFTKMTTKQIAKVVIANKIADKLHAEQNKQAFEELRKRGIKCESAVVDGNVGTITEKDAYTREELVSKTAREVLTQVGRLAECLQVKEIGAQYVCNISSKK